MLRVWLRLGDGDVIVPGMCNMWRCLDHRKRFPTSEVLADSPISS